MRNLLLTTIAILFSTLICFPNYASASHRKGISISPVNPPVESLSTVNLKTNDLIEKYTSYSREYPILISQSEDVRERYLYTKNHVWIDEISLGRYYIGLTYPLVFFLGDITFIEFEATEEGVEIFADEVICQIEGAASVADIISPIDGEIRDINTSLVDNPEYLNYSSMSPYIHHIFIVDGAISEGDSLLTWSEYKRLTNE